MIRKEEKTAKVEGVRFCPGGAQNFSRRRKPPDVNKKYFQPLVGDTKKPEITIFNSSKSIAPVGACFLI